MFCLPIAYNSEEVSQQLDSGSTTGDESFSSPAKPPGGSVAAYRILALILILRPFGNLCLAWGTKHLSQVLAINPFVYLQAMLNPYVAAGVGVLILVTLMRIALLSLADLSFVVPLTAGGYIISSLLGKFFLQEHITLTRWTGILLIFAGTVVVSTTSRRAIPHGTETISPVSTNLLRENA